MKNNTTFLLLETFSGKVNVLSIENRLDTENLLAISPSGHLILSLVKEDFQQLGIEGKPSFFNRNIIKRFGELLEKLKTY